MSQDPPNRAGYQRSFSGMAGAMIVVVVVILLWVGFRALTSDNQATPTQVVDRAEWTGVIQEAVAAKTLSVLAPTTLPRGWRVTSADYTAPGHLHLGMLTSSGRYVGLEEAQGALTQLVDQYVDADAKPGAPVSIGGQEWTSFTDSGGDYALGRFERRPDGARMAWLVVGSAPASQIRAFAASLEPTS